MVFGSTRELPADGAMLGQRKLRESLRGGASAVEDDRRTQNCEHRRHERRLHEAELQAGGAAAITAQPPGDRRAV